MISDSPDPPAFSDTHIQIYMTQILAVPPEAVPTINDESRINVSSAAALPPSSSGHYHQNIPIPTSRI
jgi:hypothetical protein